MRRRGAKKNKKLIQKGKSSTSVLVALGVTIPLAVMLVSGTRFSPLQKSTDVINPYQIFCCDTGDGDNCRPIYEKSITYNGVQYGLLKSNIFPTNRVYGHLQPTNQFTGTERIFINTASPGSPNLHREYPECGTGDFIKIDESNCTGIPDDMLIYVCRADNTPGICDQFIGKGYFDVYFRLSDYPNPGVPDTIKNCRKPVITPGTASGSGQQIIYPTYPNPGKTDLQLETFWVTQASMSAVEAYWISPFCKPAIYLYPETRQTINVKVYPQGIMSLTIPKYPKNGWSVLADIDGTLSYQNKTYDYLYYEAEIPQNLITLPDEGYVVEYQNLKQFIPDLVQKLGLNEKEADAFSEYWLKVLPQSPFYEVRIVQKDVLNSLAPLIVVPQPQTTIRVTLHFAAKEEFEELVEPDISSVRRDGFTLVEWGGLFKKDKDTPFSCLM